MLSREDNELLCRVGAGTPMGELFRRYWLPAIRSVDLAEPDCPPVRVRLLGEDLVACRDSNGRVGLLAEKCSHRRASLFYGRNEECGLRCIYHGWKYDVEGNILDTPAEPAESMIKRHVQHTAYPCHEVNGLVYTYMGPKEKQPLLPDLPWFTLDSEHVKVGSIVINDCNWLQTLEGNIDSVHSAFLHARARGDGFGLNRPARPARNQANPPRFEMEPTEWGVRAIARYVDKDGGDFIRTNTFVMPVYTALPNGDYLDDGRLDGFTVNTEVPMDDEHTMRFGIRVQRELTVERANRDYPPEEVMPDGRKTMNRENDYMIDREKQRTNVVFSGLDAANAIQDAAVVETMGVIADRWNEHLGQTDSQIAAVRQWLLEAVRDFQQGGEPPAVAFDPEDNDFSDLYLVSATVPCDKDWKHYIPQVTTQTLGTQR